MTPNKRTGEKESIEAKAREYKVLTSVLYVLIPFLPIDGMQLLGKSYFPDSLGRLACSIFPYVNIAAIFIPAQLIHAASDQCLLHAGEPAISIICFMLKITIVLVLGALLASWAFIFPERLLPPRLKQARSSELSTLTRDIKAKGSVFEYVKELFPTFLGLALFCIYLHLSIDTRPNKFATTGSGHIEEDLICVILLVTAAGLVRLPLIFVFHGLGKLGNKHD